MLTHRFLENLLSLEQNQTFCGREVVGENRVLIIGTFNPNDESFPHPTNTAEWFYGRTSKNKFWHYFPTCLTNRSLHPNFVDNVGPDNWKDYCRDERVVIIDMIKIIDHQDLLTNQKDRELESRILQDLSNVQYFQIEQAFSNSTFEKVLYSLEWSDARNLPKLVRIRDLINTQLIRQGTINTYQQIKYCKAPWRNDSLISWQNAINL